MPRPSAVRPSDYQLVRAYGEVYNLLPLEIQASQNRAARRRMPLSTIEVNDAGRVQSLFDIREPIMRQFVEERAAELWREQWAEEAA